MALMEILNLDWMGKPIILWLGFLALVLALLVFDLGVLHRKAHVMGVLESLLLSCFYILVSVLYGLWVWQHFGAEKGGAYFTGYLIEKTLSLDNIFVMSLVFAYFDIPRAYQHKVLFWGILGVLVLRGAMIGAGAALVARFEWVLLLFGAFLIATGLKMLFTGGPEPDISKNPLLRLLKRFAPVTHELHGDRFFVTERQEKTGRIKRLATPLFIVLVLVEGADIIFATDSVPAIFGITSDPFVIYTSNIFAILGLRALYFAISAVIYRFHYLKYAVALILVVIGVKVFAEELLGAEKVPTVIGLGISAILVAGGILYSIWKTRQSAREAWSTVIHRGRPYYVHMKQDD
jgi:TerC family integral membrane protein